MVVCTEALVLRMVDTGESDRVLTLYTRAHGRLEVIARGARKSFKRFGGHLSLYARVEATLDHREGRALLPLRGVRVLDAHAGLQGDLASFAAASYLAELLLRATRPDQRDGALWAAASDGFAAVAGAGERTEALVHVVEARLLDALGVLPALDACTACGASFEGGAWVPRGSDGLYCDRCRPLDRASEPIPSASLRWIGASLVAGRALDAPVPVVIGCRPLVYEAICALLGARPRSLDFLVEMLDGR
ncbi:MAG: hypothetical protein AMXMBFR64_53590 [Myxococcales bacterium]